VRPPRHAGSHRIQPVFQPRISLKAMVQLCRSLGTLLHSGVSILKALDVVSRKTGNARCRGVLREVSDCVSRGDDLATAFACRPGYFPDLFLNLMSVAEQSGAMPEVLAALADHYENTLKLRRSFLGSIAWPLLQLLAAILVVALLILVLGLISSSAGGQPVDMLGFGLLGVSGAITWLCGSFGTLGGIGASYYVVANLLQQKRFLDGLLLRIPVVGHCLRSFAIARFSWAYFLTQHAGMRIVPSLEASLRATNNGAFIAAIPAVTRRIKASEDLGSTLDAVRLFPEDYLQMVQVAEASGTVPEALHRLSPQFEDQARRSLQALAATLGWTIWAGVAGLIIFIIFSVFSRYIGMIQDAARI